MAPSTRETPAVDLEDLMRCYYPAMARLAYSLLGDSDEAEDAAQEAFIAAAANLNDFRGGSPRAWLYAITTNTCFSMLRKRRTRQALTHALQSVQSLFGREPAPEEQVSQVDDDHRLWAAVDRLDDKHRAPVVLFYEHDLPVAEIAAILGVSEGTVHSRLYYARQQLLRQFKRGEPPEALP